MLLQALQGIRKWEKGNLILRDGDREKSTIKVDAPHSCVEPVAWG